MMIRFFLLVLVLPYICIAQINQPLEKIILNNKTGYFCKVKSADRSILLTRFNLESPERDSIFLFDQPGGMFELHPIVWDLIDSTLFQVRIYTTGDGMQYAELRGYKERLIKAYANKDVGYDYIASQNTLLDNSLPLNSYIQRIKNHEDTLKGALYFDIIATNDALLLYIYLDDLKILETWSFSRYLLSIRKVNDEEGDKLMNQKRWVKVKSISADLKCPFQLVPINNNIFAVTNSGDLFDFSKEYAQEVKMSTPLKNCKGIIINKQLASTKYHKMEDWYPSNINFSRTYKSLHLIKPK